MLSTDGELRLGSFVELSGEVLQVLAEASLLDVEVFGIVPQGDVAADALGQRT
jgi:hypothetical protein